MTGAARGNLLGAIGFVAVTLAVTIPALVLWTYHLWPPERVIEHRRGTDGMGGLVETLPAGESAEQAGIYQIMRPCRGRWVSVEQWVTASGPVQRIIGPHGGSVPIEPGEPQRIAKQITVPSDALPGTEYVYRTSVDWQCYPWLGPLAPPWHQEYRDVRIRVLPRS